MYSAIKVNGKKLYEYARKGETVDVKSRNIEIYNIKLLSIDTGNKQIEFEVSCSKGTYIRSLCEDVANKLGTVGYMCELNRVKVGEFDIKDSIDMKDLNEITLQLDNCSKIEKQENKELHIITIEELFKDYDKIELETKKLRLFLNGVQLTNIKPDGVYRIYLQNKFIGIGAVKDNLLKRDIILE